MCAHVCVCMRETEGQAYTNGAEIFEGGVFLYLFDLLAQIFISSKLEKAHTQYVFICCVKILKKQCHRNKIRPFD